MPNFSHVPSAWRPTHAIPNSLGLERDVIISISTVACSRSDMLQAQSDVWVIWFLTKFGFPFSALSRLSKWRKQSKNTPIMNNQIWRSCFARYNIVLLHLSSWTASSFCHLIQRKGSARRNFPIKSKTLSENNSAINLHLSCFNRQKMWLSCHMNV